MDQPLVSIITVTKNSEKFLEETIQSVINQTYPNIEYIIIDGLSNDNTLQIIKKYENKINYCISEIDHSMYDAINKGIKISTGDIIAILNSDDCYVDQNVVTKIVDYMIKRNAFGVYGDVIILNDNKKRYRKHFQISYEGLLISGQCTFVPHPTLFLRREFIKDIGLYNLEYKYGSDFDFILRCLKSQILSYYSIPITVFRRHAYSISSSGKIEYEKNIILKKYMSKNFLFYKKYFKSFYWIKFIIINLIHNLFTWRFK